MVISAITKAQIVDKVWCILFVAVAAAEQQRQNKKSMKSMYSSAVC